MNSVYTNLGLGTFWLFVAGWMYMTKATNDACVAVIVILGLMFYWAAFKIFKDPKLAKKNKQNLVQKMTDPNYKNTNFKKKK
jgi:NADH:ubiquinone oxidoreductase subunit 6 (subunit J)